MKPIIIIFAIIAIAASDLNQDHSNMHNIPKTSKLSPFESENRATYFLNDISLYDDNVTTVAPPQDYTFLALLYMDGFYFCNGALISNEWVLTSATCAGYSSTNTSTVVNMGMHITPSTEVTIHSSEIIPHEDYDKITTSNDIGLIKLRHPVQLTESISVIDLPSASDQDLNSGINVTIVECTGKIIFEAIVETITNEECELVFGSSLIQPTKICTTPGDDLMYRKLGSPLVYETPTGYKLRGVQSFVSPSDVEAPVAHTRVVHYLDWIEEKTGLTFNN